MLTKVDIMDRGTSARDVLLGREVALRMGWVAVVNRAQADLNANLRMEDARRRERDFFQSRDEYRDLPNVGTGVLAGRLSEVLEARIRREVPSLQRSIQAQIEALEEEAEALGGAALEGRGEMAHEALRCLDAFQRAFADAVDGGPGGGERILDVFDRQLAAEMRALPFDKLYSTDSVDRIITEADGYQPYLVAPELGYRRLIEAGLVLVRARVWGGDVSRAGRE